MSQTRKSTSNNPTIRKHIKKNRSDTDYESSDSDSCQVLQKRYVKLWKPDEDELLQKFYPIHKGNWNLIAAEIPDRNPSQCSQRWKRINPNRVKLRKQWTEEEDKQVLRLISKYGKNWKRIENEMSGRSGKQIRERFINKLDKAINHEPFTDEEDEIIYLNFMQHGPKWSDISKQLQGRPVLLLSNQENMVKNRFYSFIRKQRDIDVKAPLDLDSCEEEVIEVQIEQEKQLATIQSVREDQEGSLPAPYHFNASPRSLIRKENTPDVILGAYNNQYFNSLGNKQNQFGTLNVYSDSLDSNGQQHPIPQLFQMSSYEMYGNIPMPSDNIFNIQFPVEENGTTGQNFKSLSQQMYHMSLESNQG